MRKFLRELTRLYSKITDRLFLTQNFHKYQIKYSKIYSNNYDLKRNQFSLVHIPKTAGSSVSNFLRNNNAFVFDTSHNLVSKRCDPKDYNYITTMRNPLSRTMSFFKMQLYNRKLAFHQHAKKGFSFFITRLKINQNCICKFILGDLDEDINVDLYEKAKKNLRNFWYIINFENIESDIEKLASKLKLELKVKLEHVAKKKGGAINLSTKETDLLYKHNEFDMKLFRYYENNLKVN